MGAEPVIKETAPTAYSSNPQEIHAMSKLSALFFMVSLINALRTQVECKEAFSLHKPSTSSYAARANKQRGQRSAEVPRRWNTFVGPDADFSVQFPAEPRLEEGIQEEGEVAIRRRYSYYGAPLWLSITFQDLGFPPDSRQANELTSNLDELMALYTKDRGGKIIRVRRLAKNIIEFERRVPSKQSKYDRHIITRFIQRNSRMYILACVPLADGQEVDKNVCRRFFKSFRITGVPH